MNQTVAIKALASLTLVGLLASAPPLLAQVAGGSTTVEASVTTQTQLAMGWSVKKTLLGKNVYNDAGQKVGKVDDLIISPDKNLSYIIVGAGGFIGIGRHDVAILVSQIQEKGGKLVLPGASKDSIKAMPEFTYAIDTSKRDAFIAASDQEIAKGKTAVASLEKKSAGAAADAKAKIELDITALKADLKSAEAKLADMKQASAKRWKEFEADVTAATSRLHKSTEKANG